MKFAATLMIPAMLVIGAMTIPVGSAVCISQTEEEANQTLGGDLLALRDGDALQCNIFFVTDQLAKYGNPQNTCVIVPPAQVTVSDREFYWEVLDRDDRNVLFRDPEVGTYTYSATATAYSQNSDCSWEWLCQGSISDQSTILSRTEDDAATAGYKLLVPAYGTGSCDPTIDTTDPDQLLQTFDGCVVPYTTIVGPGFVCLEAHFV